MCAQWLSRNIKLNTWNWVGFLAFAFQCKLNLWPITLEIGMGLSRPASNAQPCISADIRCVTASWPLLSLSGCNQGNDHQHPSKPTHPPTSQTWSVMFLPQLPPTQRGSTWLRNVGKKGRQQPCWLWLRGICLVPWCSRMDRGDCSHCKPKG